jgi:malate synthase
MAQDELSIPKGTIKATVLIETITATFEENEILYELRDHSSGLNCGRWDYIFSYIKKLRNKDMLLPNRAEVTMTVPFMRAYTLYTIKTCHRRGAHAIGGMAAQIPSRDDPEWTEFAYNKVHEDKEREAKDGHDGTWVAHPGMVQTAKEVFDEIMPQSNQIDKQRDDVDPTSDQLLEKPEGNINEDGFRNNVSVGVQYLAAWLAGRGAVPIFGLMEDTATAEISRAQVWQLIHHPNGKFDDGTEVTEELFNKILDEELDKIKELVGPERWEQDEFEKAAELFARISTDDDFVEFLTYPGYEYLD